QQRAVLVGHAGDRVERLQHAGGGLTVHDGHQLGGRPAQLGGDWIGLEHATPGTTHGGDHGAAALGDLDEQQSEAPALADDHTVGGVFENSPWVAEQAWAAGPFADVTALHAAMCDAVRGASRARQLALLGAHPDLAGRAARAGAMSAASVAEQASAGLDRLTD